MFILNEKRINIYAPFTTPEGVTYGNLTDPVVRNQLGVVEISEPATPEDYSESTYYRTEQDEAPYVVYARKPDDVIALETKGRINAESLRYLNETDWYVVRFAEAGAPIPEDVKLARQAARDAIVSV